MPPAKQKKSSKMKVVVELHLTYEMIYDINSKEFGDAFGSFRAVISRNGTINDMLAHVAHNVQLDGGPGSHVEGVGWVSVRGLVPDKWKDQYTGIDFKSPPSAPDIDIISNDYI
jgi:hypothetical protein